MKAKEQADFEYEDAVVGWQSIPLDIQDPAAFALANYIAGQVR
jgi:hypothetical protein